MKTGKEEKNKALVITNYPKINSTIKKILFQRKIDIETEFTYLYSLSLIKNKISKTHNTVVVRNDFSSFVHNNGFPELIILDYTIDLGLDSKLDPDKRKLLRTFMISYILFYKEITPGLKRGNFLFIYDNNSINDIRIFTKKPILLLDILKTNSDEINNVIKSLQDNPAEFNKLFNIKFFNVDEENEEIGDYIDSCLSDKPAVEPEQTTVSLSQKMKEQPENVAKSKAAVLFRFNKFVYINNKSYDIDKHHKFENLTDNIFYIVGNINSMNKLQIFDSVKDAILNGIGKRFFHKTDVVTISLSTNCSIDNTIAAHLLHLITNELKSYPNITISVNFENAMMLKSSKGYNFIKDYLRHEY